MGAAAMQVYNTAEWLSGRLYCNGIMRMYAIDSIALIYALDDDDDTEPKSGRWYSQQCLTNMRRTMCH
jgi:hypothetical protein